jgi:hypothetical protein
MSDICDVESTLREYNDEVTEKEKRKKRRNFYFLRDGERKE